jgi:poly(A) polymerase
LEDLDLSLYAGRWVALVRGRVAGVGRTADEARRASQGARPKERPELRFVTSEDWQNDPLLRRTWRILKGQHAEALLVGGAVRDGLLGRPLHDLDFVVNGDATALAGAVARILGSPLVPLDQERDIARVVVFERERRYYLDFSRRHGESWYEDLQARDFTVNAIAVDAAGRYLDPLGGREDLAAARLRAPSESAFREDPLRTLRAARLMAELEMTLESETAALIRRDASLLPHVAPERIRDEFVRVLDAPRVAHHLVVLDDLGLSPQFLPEIAALNGVAQSPPHHWDVGTHTRLTVEAVELLTRLSTGYPAPGMGAKVDGHSLRAPGWVWGDLEKRLSPLQGDLVAHLQRVVSDVRDRRFLLKLAALFHDAGKPQKRSFERPRTGPAEQEGRIRFIGHERLGAELAAERMRFLRFSGHEIERVETIVAHHMRPSHLARARGPTRRAIYRYFKATGDAGVEVALLSLADVLATWSEDLPSPVWLRQLEVVGTLLHAFFDQPARVSPAPLVDGHELMEALELPPGPEVGRLLEEIREAQATGQVKTRAGALALAARLKREI